MTSQEKVLKLWPDATITRDSRNAGFQVTIKPGRYAYGRMKSWAWKSALDSIQQDDELSKGATP